MGCSSSGGGGKGGGSADSRIESMLQNPLLANIPDNERKDLYYFQGHSADSGVVQSMVKAKNTEGIENIIKYDNVLINESLPQLTGTPKQIAYAESLRRGSIMQDVETIVNRAKGSTSRKDELITMMKQLDSSVTTFSDAVNAYIKKNPRSGYNQLRNITSAREILDRLA